MAATNGMKLSVLALLLLIFFPPKGGDAGGVLPARFNDDITLQLVQQIQDHPPFNGQPVAEVERIFGPAPDGPLHRAITALPRPYTAVLFAAFHEHFAGRAFADNHVGQGDPLCVMLKDFRLLPDAYRPTVAQSTTVLFADLHRAWIINLRDPLPQPDADAQVAVPTLLRPLLLTTDDPNVVIRLDLPTRRYGDLKGRFLDVYVAHYLVPGREASRNEPFLQGRLGIQNQRPTLRLTVLRAFFWVLVVQPFLQLIADNPGLLQGLHRHPPFDLAQLVPAELGGGPGLVPGPAPAPVPEDYEMVEPGNEGVVPRGGGGGEEETNLGPAFELADADLLPDLGLDLPDLVNVFDPFDPERGLDPFDAVPGDDGFPYLAFEGRIGGGGRHGGKYSIVI